MDRRNRPGLIAACGFALILSFVAHLRGQITGVEHVAMVVDDMDRSIDFYTRVLDFKKLSDSEIAGAECQQLYGVFGMRARVVELRLGDEKVELTEFLTPRGRAVPRDSRSNDRWFQHIAIVTTDMDRAYARLRDHKVRHASTGPQTLPSWNENAGGIKAFYFRDPDDHNLEVIYFPPGKGDPKWQKHSELFAGIDHTAIVVQSTATSLAFYRDALGLRVAGHSENYGAEQEHLNNVEGAHLQITGLRAQDGPGVEFLEYVAPTDGKPYPLDARANDLIVWHTTFTTADAAGLMRDLRAKGYTIVTRGDAPVAKRFLARDGDGHFVEFAQR
jgi:catechol 2,3-dioxygenase-like lactoylglutathione lyase family enzyme